MSASPAEKLESYLSGQWSRGEGVETELVDPVNGAVLATASARRLDLGGALDFARAQGGPALAQPELCGTGEAHRRGRRRARRQSGEI